eukprot:370595_1
MTTLYITGAQDYNGILLDEQCYKQTLWEEILHKNAINTVINKWRDNWQLNENKQEVEDEEIKIQYNKEIGIQECIQSEMYMNDVPLRTIIHKTRNLKMSYAKHKGASKCKHFALIFIPVTGSKKMDSVQYRALVEALRKNKYFCNVLNRECIYVSGPEYGTIDYVYNKDGGQNEERFDLDSLERICKEYIDTQSIKRNNKELKIEIAVHKLDRETYKQTCEDKSNKLTEVKEHEILFVNENINNTYVQPLLQDAIIRNRFNSVHQSKISFADEPEPTTGYEEIYSAAKLKQEYPVFALIWLKVRDKNSDDNKHQKIGCVLPALSVMKRLHQQPYDRWRTYRVEIFGYDECYENLDLVIDRQIMWKDALLVFMQCTFLPVFVAVPPMKFIQCCCKQFKFKPRHRPFGQVDPEFASEILDKIELIPYDISALWKPYFEQFTPWGRVKEIVFRLVSFILAFIMYWIVIIGPVFLYKRNTPVGEDYRLENVLLFFDCWGPCLLYGLAVFTIAWWSCATRSCISPNEHELLFNELIANRPMKRKYGNQRVKRTDWSPLVNISASTILTAFIYAYRKGFFQLRTSTHVILSCRPLKWSRSKFKLFKIVFMFIALIMIYFFMQNLENFEDIERPFGIEGKHSIKLTYCIASQLLSLVFVFLFILLWETMFDRIGRYLDDVKTLSNLIIKNPYSEYITFSRIDNILSWLALEKFVK